MKDIRRKEKSISSKEEMIEILNKAKYVTIAMCLDNIPYLVTLTHGYDSKNNIIFFHCANEGKKIDILRQNNLIWGQALVDRGYVEGKCDHRYATTQFKGKVTFVEDLTEKEHALELMIEQQEIMPEKIRREQINEKSIKKVNIGRIDIIFLSGKKSE